MKAKLIRTTIYLTPLQHEQVKQQAFIARVSLAEYIRRAVSVSLMLYSEPTPKTK